MAIKRVVWLRKGSTHTAHTASHPLAVNVYAGLTQYGMTKPHFVTGAHKQKMMYKNKKGREARNITASEYKHVLQQTLLPEGCRSFGARGLTSWELQQDNDQHTGQPLVWWQPTTRAQAPASVCWPAGPPTAQI